MTPPTRLTDRKRDAIVQAAIVEFRANGFVATSVDKVAARAEVSKRTLYNHFPSKDELFAAILHILWESSASALQRAYGLRQAPGNGLDHGLAYQALAQGQVDVVDAYTTDAQIQRLHLRVRVAPGDHAQIGGQFGRHVDAHARRH